jgi:serine/threonine protein kinase
LDLFIKVCQAIQHAHQKGIIHRDIKPSNILVTLHDGVPVPKVIDFGIAKVTEGRLTDNTVYTQLHQFIGTPAYMSPEQAEMSGLDIDTRRDIYSLGVLLYELLAGSTPFDAKELMSLGIDAIRKTIREKEPQRPSTRLATLILGLAVSSWQLVVARRARNNEQQQRLKAEAEQQRALEKAEQLAREAYVNRVSRAYSEVQDDKIALAEDLLHGCSPERRGWECHFVKRLGNSEHKLIELGATSVNALAFSTDGTRAVAASGDHTFGCHVYPS